MSERFSEFSPVSKAEWLDKVIRDLRGKPLTALDWQLSENWSVSPFAHADDLTEVYQPLDDQRSQNAWEVGVRLSVDNPKSANQQALELLERGANALIFQIQNAFSTEAFNALFQGIELAWISTHFELDDAAVASFWENFPAFLAVRKIDGTALRGSVILKKTNEVAPARWQQFAESLPQWQLLAVDGRCLLGNAADTATELATALRTANTYLQLLYDQKWSATDWLPRVKFILAAGDSYLLQIAKVRALRLLWQQLQLAWSIAPPQPAAIEAHLTERTHAEDANYNKIGATARAMAMVIGGVHRLVVYPSDRIGDQPGTPFGQRIALNVQHLMQMESYLDRTVDPAAGSYFLEKLTDDLAARAWTLFTEEMVGDAVSEKGV